MGRGSQRPNAGIVQAFEIFDLQAQIPRRPGFAVSVSHLSSSLFLTHFTRL